MDLEKLREERKRWLGWKKIAPVVEALDRLAEPKVGKIEFADIVSVELEESYEQKYARAIEEIALMMKPWRKGPFRIGSLYIDSEWRSFIKYNLLKEHFNLQNRRVADIGCNNGYYLFRMLEDKPASLTGFDPSALYYMQFRFIDRFVASGIRYELLGVEHLPFYEEKFDTIFCLGVLYHRSDPVSTLKALRRGLEDGGELFLDTFMIEGEDEICLTPAQRYSKIPNIYFIPTFNALKNWCLRAGFDTVEAIAVKATDTTEQRKTQWIDTQSLNDFLDPRDPSKTVEGYPAPTRLYIKATTA